MSDSTERFARKIDDQVRQDFTEAQNDTDEPPSESEIEEKYHQYFQIFKLLPEFRNVTTDEEGFLAPLIRQYKEIQPYRKRIGFSYSDEETKPWIEADKVNKGFYWGRYRRYLITEKHWDPATVNSMDADTNNILDSMADPCRTKPFDRRGLVVASVQSGKTSNYIALISKAADAGYRILIVLAGITNELRNQTQKRIEEGFAGVDISKNRNERVGAGLLDDSHSPVVITSRTRDYNKATADSNKGLFTKQVKAPMLFVIKKNVKSLRGLILWLKDNSLAEEPLLLIDDEADNASINVKYGKQEVSRINGQIRQMLGLTQKHVYVGYTATPFANVLIDSRSVDEGFGSDIFPKSFIYTLEQSPDYFGAEKVFGDADTPQPRHLRWISDIDEVLPPRHKSSASVESLPESLQKAIRCYLVACAERDLRGQGNQHMSMMVNVSPYNKPQHDVAFLVGDYLGRLREDIVAFGGLSIPEAERSSSALRELRRTWDDEYASGSNHSWEEICHSLGSATKDIHVIEVNSKSEDDLVYPDDRSERVIAVGGYSLSRGLTLEGLMVSYYSRNAKAYDSLMQMARWFGYRFGYEDLCRVWMTESSAAWYSFVTDVTSDLVRELRDMRTAESRPEDYGLLIRKDPDTLEITARDKMGAGTTLLKVPVRLDGKYVETRALFRDTGIREKNTQVVVDLLQELQSAGYRDSGSKKVLFRKVPMHYLTDFLLRFNNCDDASPNSQHGYIIEHLGKLEDAHVADCDILLETGSEKKHPLSIPHVEDAVFRERRRPGENTDERVVFIGNKQMTASRGEEKNVLPEVQIREAKEQYRRDLETRNGGKASTNYPSSIYRFRLDRPLLVIHPLALGFPDNLDDDKRREIDHLPNRDILPGYDGRDKELAVSWGLSLPRKGIAQDVSVVCNEVYLRRIQQTQYEEAEELKGEDIDDDD